MTHTYKISGMTCTGCEATVQHQLSKVKGVKDISIDLSKGEATLSMDKHLPIADLQSALVDYPKYQLIEDSPHDNHKSLPAEEVKPWLETYKPILLVFGYIIGTTILMELTFGGFSWERWMNHFMAGFFLVFSFFKFLDLKGFAESYSTYDIIAKRWVGWGMIYPFTELAIGLAFLSGFYPLVTNAVTFVVMGVSIIGVSQTVLNKKKIRCACLGAVFNLPMSAITIIEDALMIGMSFIMLIRLAIL
jgi:copper chaperone CopZ